MIIMHTVDGEHPAPVNNLITLGSYETVHNPWNSALNTKIPLGKIHGQNPIV